MTKIDIIASSSAPCGLSPNVVLSGEIVAKEGYCLAVRALESNEKYNVLEGAEGILHTIVPGTTFVGALGGREALKGYRGHVPAAIAVGDVLSVLNMGGILGLCTADHPSLGEPVRVEVLGAVMVASTDDFGGNLTHACIQQSALPPLLHLPKSAPLITVCGTAMDTGKTRASAAIVTGLSKAGFKVAAAKLTGAALLRDIRDVELHGAITVASFADCGFVSSTGKKIVPHAKAVLAKLNEVNPDVIVVELGDGLIGPYGVDEFLLDRELTDLTCATVVAATDLAGAWAATRLFAERYRRGITAMTGPVTDNAVGADYIEGSLGIKAHNALKDAAGLTSVAKAALINKVARKQTPAATRQLVA